MRGNNRFLKAGTILFTLLLGLPAGWTKPSESSAAEPIKFILISGSPGGGWYTQAGVVSQAIKKALPTGSTVTIVPGTGVGNVISANQNAGQMAYTFTAWAGWASKGTGPFTGKGPQTKVRAVATLDQNFVTIVARGDLPFNSLREVKEKKHPIRLLMNRPTSDTGGVVARYIFEQYGWGPAEQQPFFSELQKWGGKLRVTSVHGEAVSLMRDGHADMWVIASSFNHPPIVELATARNLKFMGLDGDAQRALMEKYGLPTFTVPANSFKYMDQPTPFIGVKTVLTTNSQQPADLIYGVTKALAEEGEAMCKTIKRLCEFDPKKAWENTGFGLHAGAARYYKEKGYLKEGK